MNIEIEKLSHAELIELVKVLMVTVNAQSEKISELEARLNQNSSNSSTLPSHDWKPMKMPRVKTGANAGVQPGHKGNFLKIERPPDETVELKPQT